MEQSPRVAGAAVTAQARWKKRPMGSTWGDFGVDDQLGRLNLLTPERVLAAIAEVKVARTFCLSLPLDFPGGTFLNPRRRPPELMPTSRDGRPNMAYPMSLEDPRSLDVMCDDMVIMTLQYSTQWDSLAHFGQQFDADDDGELEMVFYNGFRAGVDIGGPIDYRHGQEIACEHHLGAIALGIENMAASCVQGRGVMVDLHAHFGDHRTLVGYSEWMAVLDKDRIDIRRGDLVCINTGFGQMLLSMNKKPDVGRLKNSFAVLDGRDERLLQWITDSGIAALIADNNAVEAVPARAASGDRVTNLPLHEHCLFRLGVHLGELWYLTELATWLRDNGRSHFLLTAPPLRLPRAVGSPVTPVATV
jgi:Putative cyclase